MLQQRIEVDLLLGAEQVVVGGEIGMRRAGAVLEAGGSDDRAPYHRREVLRVEIVMYPLMIIANDCCVH